MLTKTLFLTATAILLSACQRGSLNPSAPTLSLTEKSQATSTATPTSIPDIKQLLNIKEGQMIYAVIKTNLGSMRIKLFEDKAPNTVTNFVGLAEGTKDWTDPKTGQKVSGKPYYNGVIFHRIISGFMIQGGDPTGTGMGGPGYKFADEINDEKYIRGTLAMANSGPNTNGSQFFIVHKDYPLPSAYAVCGRIDPLDDSSIVTLDKIAAVAIGANDKPTSPVTMESVSIVRQ